MDYGNTDYENDWRPLGDAGVHGGQGLIGKSLMDDDSLTPAETRRRHLSWDLPAAFLAPRDHTSLGRTPVGEFFLHD